MIEFPLISLALFIVAFVTLGLAIYALANLRIRGAIEFSLLMVSLTFYIAGFGMELLSPTKSLILFWLRIEYLGISSIPVFCILLAIRLAGNDNWLKWVPLRIALFLPVVTLILYYTDSWHHLFYKSIGDVRQVFSYFELEIQKGPWYYVHVIYLNLALLGSVILFLRKLRKDNVERRQAWILICGSLGPWIAHLVYQAGLTSGFDISPFGFLLTAPLFAWGVFGNHIVFLLPKARNSVYQSFGDPVLILDNQKNLVDYNHTAGSLFKKLKRDMIGKPALEFFGNYPELMTLLTSADSQRIQVRINLNSVWRSFILSKSGVNSKSSHRLGEIIVMHEITDQVFLLDNLRESEEKYRLIFDNAPVGVMQYDKSGKITTCNDAFVKIIGSSRELLIGMHLLSLPDRIMVKAVSDSLNGLVGYYEQEYHSVTALKVTPVRGFFAPIATKDGQIRGGVGIVEDFTEKYQADLKIKYREEFESILMTLELDFLNTDIGEIDNTFNRGLMRLGAFCKVDRAYIFRFDFEKEVMINTHEWCSTEVKPETLKFQTIPMVALPRWMEQLKKSETIYIPDISKLPIEWKSEMDILDTRGTKSLIVVPIEISGELLGFAGFDSLRDLRTWNKDEIALLQVLGQIFASVIKRKEANEELVTARDRAEEASRVKSTFLANMSHEIRTPLNGILGFAELILTETKDPVTQKYSDIILSSGNRLLYTLSQILDLSRVESGKLDLNIEIVKAEKVINDIILLFTPAAKKKGLFIERQHGGAQLVFKLDEQLFRNSLTNLVSNSIKFTDHGGITISTAIEVINGKRFGTIRVADTGIGIHEKHFETIFEDFKQVSEGVRRNYEGTGLGLSLTKKFVHLSGGHIRVESIPGFGATFMLSFPDPVVEQ
jgi:PAS domain S-box-containing protein